MRVVVVVVAIVVIVVVQLPASPGNGEEDIFTQTTPKGREIECEGCVTVSTVF